MSKFYITTPIYYVNDNPHIGSAYTTVAADVLARWHRQSGDATFFLTGTDEHGAKVAAKAAEAGKDPQEFVNGVAENYETAWRNLNISYDRFIRTSESEHIVAVQKALEQMYEQGDIYLGKYEGLYCKGCEQYKSERDLVKGRCAEHGTVPEKMSEECYMFRLSKYGEELLAKIKNDELLIQPSERKNEVISFYEKEGLLDIAFSRKNVKWGVPLPWDEAQTAYVWADAFLNYLTGLNWPNPVSNVSELWPPDLQLMSKDIIRVHATIWPAMLESLGLELPKELFVHGYFLTAGKKMSKSLGNIIRPEEITAKYGVDATRYLLMSVTPFGNDGDVSWARFDEKYNADLANGLGNLVARVANLLEKNAIRLDLSSETGDLNDEFGELMEELKLEEALRYIWDNFRALDSELAEKKPWEEKDLERLTFVLVTVAQRILSLAILIEPFMPDTSKKIVAQFSAREIKKGESLFPRI